MTIVHRSGRQHRNADALSRIPCRQCGFDPNWENTENLAQHARNIQERKTQEVDEKEVFISEKQKSDKDLTLIRKWVEKGEKPELKEITGESITVKSMWAQFDQLTIIDVSFLYVSSMLCQIFCVFPIWIKSALSTRDATERIGISMLSTWTMYNRHIIGAEYLKPPCHLSFGIFEV
jgi:hypothetical protein